MSNGAKYSLVFAAALIIIALFGLNTDLIVGLNNGAWDLSYSHSVCASALGAMLQASSTTDAHNCSTVNGWYTFTLVLLWGGILLAVGTAVKLVIDNNRR